MLNTTAGDLDDPDENDDELSERKQNKVTFLPTYGAFSARLVSGRGLLTIMFQIQRTLFTIRDTG